MQRKFQHSEKNIYSDIELDFIKRCTDADAVRCVKNVKNGVVEVIMGEVDAILPADIVNDTAAVIEFSNQHAGLDALLPAYYHESYGEKAVANNYVTAMTTIWLANHTKLAGGKSLDSCRRTFQCCLLNYFFNTIVGSPPFKAGVYIERRTLKRYGLVDWYFNDDKALFKERAQILIDTMHHCGLQYCSSAEP